MTVLLNYFRPSGKWYSEGEYTTEQKDLWMIWAEVEGMLVAGRLPGLVDGAKQYIVSVDVPEHPHRHPNLIIRPDLYD